MPNNPVGPRSAVIIPRARSKNRHVFESTVKELMKLLWGDLGGSSLHPLSATHGIYAPNFH